MAEATIGLLTAVAILIGAVMFLSARFFLKPDAPRGHSWNPKKWIPMWRQKDFYRSPGFLLIVAGYTLIVIGFVIRTIYLPWPC